MVTKVPAAYTTVASVTAELMGPPPGCGVTGIYPYGGSPAALPLA